MLPFEDRVAARHRYLGGCLIHLLTFYLLFAKGAIVLPAQFHHRCSCLGGRQGGTPKNFYRAREEQCGHRENILNMEKVTKGPSHTTTTTSNYYYYQGWV